MSTVWSTAIAHRVTTTGPTAAARVSRRPEPVCRASGAVSTVPIPPARRARSASRASMPTRAVIGCSPQQALSMTLLRARTGVRQECSGTLTSANPIPISPVPPVSSWSSELTYAMRFAVRVGTAQASDSVVRVLTQRTRPVTGVQIPVTRRRGSPGDMTIAPLRVKVDGC